MKYQINKVTVLGAGVMGSGIAAHIAGIGIPVCLLDMVPNNLTDDEKARGLTLESAEVRNKLAKRGKDNVTNPRNKSVFHKSVGQRIEIGNFEDNMDMISDSDWVIEVIVEKLEPKKEMMKKIAKYVKEGAIVSSNTSGVSINKIVEDMPLAFRQHFMGTHFFNPPRYMKLFELIPSRDTSQELVDFMAAFATKRLGKGVVSANDTPNFIGNRIGAYAFSNAIQMMDKYNYSIPKVDLLLGTIVKRPKSAIFKTMDMVGLDIYYNVANNVINNIDDEREKLEFKVPEIVQNLINKGYMGDKAKQGFYKTEKTETGKKKLVWDEGTQDYVALENVKVDAIGEALQSKDPLKAIINGSSEENKFVWEITKNVLLYSARRVPEITTDYRLIDKAMVWGYNWALGPFQMWDSIGVEDAVERMEKEGETIPQWVLERIKEGNTKFYSGNDIDVQYTHLSSSKNKVVRENSDAALIDIGDDVLCLQFKSKGNTITDDVMTIIYEAVEETEKNYKGLVIGNESKNFSAGANLVLISQLAREENWKGLEAVVDKFQKANMALKYCKKPVVAAPFNMTLGGGAEIAMHAHKVTPSVETYMGLVEVGVGLIPGGGGTKELLLRATENLNKPTSVERVNVVKKVWQNIATAKVSGSAYEASEQGFIRTSDKIVMNNDYLIDEAKKMVLAMAEDGFTPLQEKVIYVVGTKGRAAIQYEINFMKNGHFISDYDAYLADKIAYVLTGGDVPDGTMLREEQMLQLEKDVFVALCKEEKTQKRIDYMLKTGRALRN
ncbi:enoyl-CoA hydratase/isomerase family protein [Fusibacter paucivorans]|uniref:Enoyl-CoA hydratase/isomerase family protein n=1 Tax=Fusibacter paucivorans TaxID=76009 RepID=A0ABS5PU08_9FIRM|nr:3-hydroxyacyl-CoA dehydrogenase NAD-binding domain-containing protein [Fusibacter paucivorans]MBS7528658.1 enoyl-CoA hydratase/isomerase family protein [Fusibacter paucivorans]